MAKTSSIQVSVESIYLALKAARTEGRLCQKNWQVETAKEEPSEKRLSFLSNQGQRLHRICSVLESLLPSDFVEPEQSQTVPSPMDFKF